MATAGPDRSGSAFGVPVPSMTTRVCAALGDCGRDERTSRRARAPPWRRQRAPHVMVAERLHADDEVLGVAEARSGHADVLLVVEHHTLAGDSIEHLPRRSPSAR